MDQIKQDIESDEIDLMKLIKKIWLERKLVLYTTLICTFFGITSALIATNIYQATTTFIVKGENIPGNAGGLSNLASLAGVSIGKMSSSGNTIPPRMYPMIAKSIPFLETLSIMTISFDGKTSSLKNYLSRKSSPNNSKFADYLHFVKKYSLGLPALLMGKLSKKMNPQIAKQKEEVIMQLSTEDEEILNGIQAKINIEVDKKEGFITLSFTDEDPRIAAMTVMNIQDLLQKEIINYKIKNAADLLVYTENSFQNKKVEFEALQDELANFRDQHQNISSRLFENKLNRLESEFSMTRSVYEEMARQVEQAKIQLNRDTPIFTIIDPVIIPNKKIKPRRSIIVISSFFIGLILGSAFILLKDPIIAFKNELIL